MLNFGLFISEKKADNNGMAFIYRVEKWSGNYTPDAATLRGLLIAEGFAVHSWSDPPGVSYGSHRHDTDQSHWIISGSLELVVDDAGSFVLNAGDRDFMPAYTYHTARVLGDEPVSYLIGERSAEVATNDKISGKRTVKSVGIINNRP